MVGKGEVGMKFANKKILLIAALVAVAGFGTYRLGMHIFSAQQFRFSLDSKLSPAMHNAIKQAVYESYNFPLASVCDAINKACPALEHTSIERRADNKLYIAAKSMDPYVCIESQPVRLDPSIRYAPSGRSEWRGLPDHPERACESKGAPNGGESINDIVLTSSGKTFDKACFTNEVLQPLPVITQKKLFGKATITDEFKQWLLRLDPSVFASYTVVWNDDFAIELQDKINEKQTIVCSVTTTPDKNVRELCQRIIEEKAICAQGTARKYEYTADIRFENQIIICSHKGGAVHG